MRWLLVLLGVGLLFTGQQAKQFVKQYQVKVTKVIFDNKSSLTSGYQKLFFTLEVAVINPTGFSATLRKLALALFYKNKRVATTVIDKPLEIAAKGNTTARLTVQVTTSEVFKSIQEAVNAFVDNPSVLVNIKGAALFAAGTLNIDETVKVV